LAAATPEEIRGEAGKELEGRSEIGWLLAQHNLVAALRNFHFLRAKPKILGNSHGLAISAPKDPSNGHGKGIYE